QSGPWDELADQAAGALDGPRVVERHDARMLKPGGALRLAQEPVQVFAPGEAAAARDLEGHEAIELGIAGLVDGAKGADAEQFEQLKLAEAFRGVFGQPGGRSAGVELDTGAAGQADDFAGRLALNHDRVLAMRALKRHGRDLGEPIDLTRTFGLP